MRGQRVSRIQFNCDSFREKKKRALPVQGRCGLMTGWKGKRETKMGNGKWDMRNEVLFSCLGSVSRQGVLKNQITSVFDSQSE
jgi:hypothetical protein